MNAPDLPSSRSNPFTTRHVRPGRLVPRDAAGEPLDLDALVTRARALGATALEGPHGAGKTNLLAALADRLAAVGLLADTIRIRTRRGGAVVLRAVLRAAPGATLCVDGWESLGRAAAAVIRRVAGFRGVGLIVTTHRAAGMPVLHRCGTTPALLARLVAELPDHGGLVGPADVAEAFAAPRGDVREALYDLYDRFERRSRVGEPCAGIDGG